MFWSSVSLGSKFIEPKEVMETSDSNQWVRTDYSLHSRQHQKSKECSWTFPFLASQSEAGEQAGLATGVRRT